MTDLKLPGDPRALSCNDGHDLCYCAGRPECHNCGQPLVGGNMPKELTDRELEKIIYTHFGYVAYKQMAANEKIRGFYQLDNEASIDVSGLVKGLVRLINEEKEKAKIKTLNHTLERIEEYIKDRECNTPELTISCRAMLDGKIKYRARFLMVDTEDNDGTDFVRAEGSSLEEVVGKIAGYLKSGKHYKDGRCL